MREIPLTRRPSATSPTMEVVPGVTQALKDLHQQYLCCIASNARGPESTALSLVLEKVGLDPYIRHVFTVRELEVEKPDPRFFEGILWKLRLQPQECIMVGDNYVTDIAGAKAVGLKTIWFTAHSSRDARHADVAIGDMGELAAAVKKLAAQAERAAV